MLTGDYCWVLVNEITFLNVYKAPNNPTAILPLINWNPTPRVIAAGDFNSVHAAWQQGATRPYRQGDEIERWEEDHNLSCLIIGEPTHKAGNTLDLAWTNISGARAWVDREECMTSDHLPIRGIIPSATFTGNLGLSKIRVPKKNLPNFGRAVAKWVHPAIDLSTTEKVNEYTQEICFHLSEAIKAIGTRARKESSKSAPWWTPMCKSAHAEYRAATTPTQRATCAKELRVTVTAAKKEYQTSQVEAMTSPSDIFKLMRLVNHRQAKAPPPLIHNGKFITDPLERATILRDALLARHQQSDDLLPYNTPSDN